MNTDTRRGLISTLGAVILVVSVLQTGFIPIVGPIATQLRVSPTAASWTMTANLLTAAAATPLIGGWPTGSTRRRFCWRSWRRSWPGRFWVRSRRRCRAVTAAAAVLLVWLGGRVRFPQLTANVAPRRALMSVPRPSLAIR